jgi:drug/metabolite transporter (DMT)-like permease
MDPIYYILSAVTIGVTGQLFIKKGLNGLGSIDFSSGLVSSYTKILCSPWVFGGGLVYCFSLFLWIYALTKVDLSFAYPFVALSYVIIVLAAWLFLGEHISPLRLAGVLVVSFGVILISRS